MASDAMTEMTEIKVSEDSDEKSQQQQEETSEATAQQTTQEKREEAAEEELPPLTYIDFLPQCFGSKMEGCDPVYNTFQSVVEQANQWLQSMPQFCAVKCETVDHKLNAADFSLETDQCLRHFSSHGKNMFLRGLRLWLMHKSDESVPVQQLGYITVLPDHSSGNLTTALSSVSASAMRVSPEQIFHEFNTLPVTMEKLNHHLQHKPLPGRILTVETLSFKGAELENSAGLNTEDTLWTENGKASRLFLFATRIFYVVGRPAFEKIDYHDEVPYNHQIPEDFGLRVKFAPFSKTVAHAANWLKDQRNIRAVNFQSVTLKLERPGGVGTFKANTESAGYTETQGLQEFRYVKVLRIFFVKDQKQEKVDNSAVGGVPSLHLTTRLFVPTKLPGHRSFESFSKTMQRIITWLKATGTPVLGMETVRYQVNPDSDLGVNKERVDHVANPNSGQHSIVCVRLYFPCEFEEPPPEVVPQTEEDSWGWACVVS